jgi:YihY family inner membrane protein
VTVPEHQQTRSGDPSPNGNNETGTRSRPGWIEVLVRRADRFQQRHGVLGFPFAVMQKFGNDQAGSKAALIAYYGLFALFPLLMLFTTVLGYALHNDEQLRKDLVDSALGSFPIIGPELKSQIHGLTGNALAVFTGCVLLLYGAVGLGMATQNAMNKVWNIPYVHWPSLPMRYLRGLAVLALLAASTVGSTVLTGFATLTSHDWYSRGLLLVGSLALNFVLILLAYMVMTAVHLAWRDVLLGAVLATVFWQGLQLIGSWYVGRELQHATATYGFFGIVLVLLAWIFLGAQLFLLAAEINVVKRYHLWPRSMTQPPLTPADRAVFERLARMEVRRGEFEIQVAFSPEADFDPLAPPTVGAGSGDGS